jgi:hypothetical protein
MTDAWLSATVTVRSGRANPTASATIASDSSSGAT